MLQRFLKRLVSLDHGNLLYALRNQLIHGGATWQGSVNREQIRDGAAILGELTPCVIHLLIENPEGDRGDPRYPVVNASA